MANQGCLKAHWLGTHKTRAQTLNSPKQPPWGSLEFWLKACQKWPKACYSCATQDPTRRHPSIGSPVKKFQGLQLKAPCKVNKLEEEGLGRWEFSFLQALIALNLWAFNQCWTDITLIWYHSGVYNEDFTYFDTSKIWVFEDVIVFDTMQEPLHLCKIT
jgi:hypothetical protein